MGRIFPSVLLALAFGASGCACGGMLAEQGAPDASQGPPDGGNPGADAALDGGIDSGPCTEEQPCLVNLITLSSYAPPFPGVVQVVVDGTRVYYTENDGFVLEVAIDGGPSPILAAKQDVHSIAVGENDVYWTGASQSPEASPPSNGVLKMVALDGGPITTLLEVVGTGAGIAVDSTNVYWAQQTVQEDGGFDPINPLVGQIVKMPLQGGSPTLLASSGPNQPEQLAVSATNVYWAEWDSPDDGGIMTVPIAGGQRTALVPGIGAYALAIDTTNVYWGSTGSSGDAGALWKVPLSGGTPVLLATGTPQFIAVDATMVYWTIASTNPVNEPPNGSVMAVPIEGGTPVTIASGQSPGGIAVDSTSLYWGSTTGLWKRTPK